MALHQGCKGEDGNRAGQDGTFVGADPAAHAPKQGTRQGQRPARSTRKQAVARASIHRTGQG